MKLKKTTVAVRCLLAVVGVLVSMITVKTVFAHCDTMNGPVITEAKAALEKGDVTPILKWVKKESEAEVKTAFARTVVVRAKGPEAKKLADQYFFETLVRLHRAGEGAPYTGIKDEPVEPIVAMADKALDDGSVEEMIKRINGHMAEVIREKFKKVVEAKEKKDESVEAGREFVEAYVTYTHYVEGIHMAIASAASHHHTVATEGNAQHEH
jgi:hypothetical protein